MVRLYHDSVMLIIIVKMWKIILNFFQIVFRMAGVTHTTIE